MRILWVEAEGFKGYSKKTRFEIDGKNVLITGHNGSGKTSIAELISYAIYGVTLNGEGRSIDDIININHKGSITATVAFEDPESYQTRVVSRVKNKKTTEVFVDGKPVTQDAIKNEFGNYKTFLSIFYSPYFTTYLDDNDKRAIIEDVTPKIDYEKIFEEKADISLIEKYNINIDNPKTYKEVKNRIKEIEKEIESMSAESKVLEAQNLEIESVDLLTVYDDKEKEFAQKVKDAQDVLNRQQAIRAMMNNSQLNKGRKEEIDRELVHINNKLNSIERPEDPSAIYAKSEEYTKGLEHQIRDLLGQKISESSLPKLLSEESTNNQCPTCYQTISKEHILSTNTYINSQINEIRVKNAEIDNQIGLLQEKIKECNKKREMLVNQANQKISEINQLVKKRDELQYEIESIAQSEYKLTPEDEKVLAFDKFDAINNEYKNVCEINQKAKTHNAIIQENLKRKQANFKRIDELTKHLQKKSGDLQELSLVAEAVDPKWLHKKAIEKKMETIINNLNHVEIHLFRQQKSNSEWKETFDIYYHNKPFRRLSFSEQIKCGLEISMMLNRVSGKQFPIFLDNTESVQSINFIEGMEEQVLMARFVENKPLTVEQVEIVIPENEEVPMVTI